MRAVACLVVTFLVGAGSALAEEAAIVTSIVYPGQEIAAEKIRVVKLGRPAPNGSRVARSAEDIVGLVAVRTLLPNRLISLDSVREANVIEPGKQVRAVYRSGGLSIVLMATALTGGAPGDAVKLRNVKSGRTFDGFVAADGTVTVGRQ